MKCCAEYKSCISNGDTSGGEMKKGSFISKNESIMVQAIAVMLMVFHHLFAFPERINVPYTMLFDFGFLHLETILSYGGRICISIFAFSSGYGLYKLGSDTVAGGYKLVLKQLKKFYTRLWIVCIIFIPLGYVLDIYTFNWVTLIKSVLGISSAYNGEWWYIASYLRLLLLYPIIYAVMTWVHKKTRKYSAIITGVLLIVSSLIYSCLQEKGFIGWLLCFIMGMLMVQFNVFELLYSIILKLGVFKYVIIIMNVGGVFVIRTVINSNCDYDYLFAPIIVFSIVVILKSKICGNVIISLLQVIGKYSTYIWLTHTFFAYYYFQQLVYYVKYSTLIFIWCLVCSLITGIMLEYGVQRIEKLLVDKK